ncbi:DegT/DnrJ/EryC1/StrS family aminotransferase [Hellea sp.]|nr:DegT/DnrJ/EryC1/StrS family aminotransferase [Hellea sp.]
MKFPFIDLQAQRAVIADEVDAALKRVLEHGQFILGPEVEQFETQLAEFEGGGHAVSCANGTDAIILPLKAWGVSPGDTVFCPSWTYAATAEAIAVIGAIPYFVDVDPVTYNLCPKSLRASILQSQNAKAIIAVDLFGQPANYPELRAIADEFDLKLMADSAQGMGCRLDGKAPIEWADVVTTSFFPAKPLGCYGDGGAMLTRDESLKEQLLSLRFHGRGTVPGDHAKVGLNSRLDTMQAAILIEKLKIFADEIEARNRIADRYTEALQSNILRTPKVIEGGLSIWAQYSIEVPDRDSVMADMRAAGIPVAAYYPLPTHMQTAYKDFPTSPDGLPNTMAAKDMIMALPMHAYLKPEDQDAVIETLLGFM